MSLFPITTCFLLVLSYILNYDVNIFYRFYKLIYDYKMKYLQVSGFILSRILISNLLNHQILILVVVWLQISLLSCDDLST